MLSKQDFSFPIWDRLNIRTVGENEEKGVERGRVGIKKRRKSDKY